MSFNLDAYRETHRPWTFTANGRTWVARPVSVEQVLTAQAQSVGASEVQAGRVLRGLLRLAFPRTISMRWRGDPVDLILQTTPREREAILQDFFTSLQPKAPATRPTTSTVS